MRLHKLSDMIGGWFAGDFSPTALRTPAGEVGVKTYGKGETNALHHHRVGTEVTLVLSGRARMGDATLGAGDIIVLDPPEASDFEALEDCTVVVFKTPSVPGDKYEGVHAQ